MYAVVLAFAVNAFSNTDHPSRMYNNGLEVLNEYMRVRCLPKALRERLRESYEHRTTHQIRTQATAPLTKSNSLTLFARVSVLA